MKIFIITFWSLLFSFVLNAQTLQDYLKIATDNNPGLAAKFLVYQASVQRVKQVGSLSDPMVSVGYFISPVETRVGPQEFRITASQSFPWMGTLKAKKDAAHQLALATFEEYEAAKDKLHFNVRATFYELYELDQRKRIISKNIQVLETYEALVTQKFETGTASLVDILRIQMEMADEKNHLRELEDKRVALVARFNEYLNKPIDEVVNLTDFLGLPFVIPEKEDIWKNILSSSNELRRIGFQQGSIESAIRVARKQGAPVFELGISYISVAERTDVSVPNNGRDAIMPMVSIKLPIQRSKNKAQVSEALFQLEALTSLEKSQRNYLRTAFELAWFEYTDAVKRLELNKNQGLITDQMITLLIAEYVTGGTTFEEVLRLQQQKLTYEINLVKAFKDKDIALASIAAMYNWY